MCCFLMKDILDGYFEVTEDGSTAVLNWNVGGRNELAFVDLKTLESKSGPAVPAEIVSQAKLTTPNKLAQAAKRSGYSLKPAIVM